jgi:hypothetical protein
MNQKHFMALGSALFMTLSGGAIAASSHGHEVQHSTSAVSPPVNAGKKLATDVPLRQAMANIRQAMAGSLHDIHANKLSQKAYAALAKKVEDEVAYMVANCRLGKEADEQLHLIIADLLDGAGRMAGKVKSAKRQDGAVRVIGALDKYAALFDDSRL